MPKIRQRPAQRRVQLDAALDGESRRQLLFGQKMFSSTPRLDDVTFRQLWQQHREVLMREFCARFPDRRPWAWWYVDHGQERPITALAVPDDVVAAIRQNCLFQFLNTRIYGPWGPMGKWVMLQQSEESYLRRHKLDSPTNIP